MVKVLFLIGFLLAASVAMADRVQILGEMVTEKPFVLTVSCESQQSCDDVKLSAINFDIVEQHLFTMNGAAPKLMVTGKSDKIGVKKLIVSQRGKSEEFIFVQTIRSRDSFLISDLQKREVTTWEPNKVCFLMVSKDNDFIIENEPVFRDAKFRSRVGHSSKKKLNNQQDFWINTLSCYDFFAESRPSVVIKPPIYRKKINGEKIFSEYLKVQVTDETLKSGFPWGLPKISIETAKKEYQKFDQIPIKITLLGAGYIESFSPITIYPEDTLEEVRRDETIESTELGAKKTINLIYYARESFSLEKSSFVFKYFDPATNKVVEDQIILPPLKILAETSQKQSLKETENSKSGSSGLAERLMVQTEFKSSNSKLWVYINLFLAMVIGLEIVILLMRNRSYVTTNIRTVQKIKTSQFSYLKVVTSLNLGETFKTHFHPEVVKALETLAAKEYGPKSTNVNYWQKRKDKHTLLKVMKKYHGK